jgi:hypothetical protein
MKGENKVFGSIDDVLLAWTRASSRRRARSSFAGRGDLIDLTLEHNMQDVMRRRRERALTSSSIRPSAGSFSTNV